jgi:hypothetical protein
VSVSAVRAAQPSGVEHWTKVQLGRRWREATLNVPAVGSFSLVHPRHEALRHLVLIRPIQKHTRCAVPGIRVEKAKMPDEAAVQSGKFPGRGPDRTWGGLEAAAPSDEQLRRQVRIRLSERWLFPASNISTVRPGTGRQCNVCGRSIDTPTMEHEVEGPSVFGLAHVACYTVWREESALL